jgi:hypothetical protein
MSRPTKAAQAALQREGVLAAHIRSRAGTPVNIISLSQSYNLSAQRVREIVIRNGGSIDG